MSFTLPCCILSLLSKLAFFILHEHSGKGTSAVHVLCVCDHFPLICFEQVVSVLVICCYLSDIVHFCMYHVHNTHRYLLLLPLSFHCWWIIDERRPVPLMRLVLHDRSFNNLAFGDSCHEIASYVDLLG